VTPHLVDATLFFSPTSGGVRRYLLAKHRWLNCRSRARHTLIVPGATDRGAVGGIIEFASPAIRSGYRCPLRLPQLRRVLSELEPDLLEAEDPYQIAWQVAEVADALGVPAVAFCHSDLIGLFGHWFGGAGATIAARYLRALYARFDLVFAPSEVVAARLVEAGIEHVAVQPLGVDAVTFDPARADATLRTRLGLSEGTRLLVFAGRLAPEKNIPELMAMAESLGAPYHLLIIGAREVTRPSPCVTLWPYTGDAAAIAADLAACDVLVHAGRQETFGLIALEAMACGLPVVAYEGGALAELIDSSVGELAPAAGGPAALAAAVEGVWARDPRALGRAARARVLASYTWDATLTQQMRAYALLIGQASLLHARPGVAAV